MGSRIHLPRLALYLVPVAIAFFMNPSFGCGDDFDYGEKEMKAAVEGRWTLMPVDGMSPFAALTFTLAQGTGQPVANGVTVVQQPQCIHRAFVRPAGACGGPSSSMPVEGKIIEGPADWRDRAVRGAFRAGATLTSGILELGLGADSLRITLAGEEIREAYLTVTLTVGTERLAMRAQRMP